MEHDHQILSVIANCLSMAKSNVTEIKLSLPFINIVFMSYFNDLFIYFFFEKLSFEFWCDQQISVSIVNVLFYEAIAIRPL